MHDSNWNTKQSTPGVLFLDVDDDGGPRGSPPSAIHECPAQLLVPRSGANEGGCPLPWQRVSYCQAKPSLRVPPICPPSETCS